MEAITQRPRPKNVIELISFLGLTGYYYKFAQNFSKITAPLTNWKKKNTNYAWTDKCEKAS